MIAKTSKFSVILGPPTVQNSTTAVLKEQKKSRQLSQHGSRYENCQDSFEAIFHDISNETACKASLGDRKVLMKGKDTTLTYGELDTMEPIWKVMSKLFNDGLLDSCTAQEEAAWKYYDLGSGSGRPVIAAALVLRDYLQASAAKQSREMQCIGIEILPSLYELSVQARDKWKTTSSSSGPPVQVTFILGSIFDLDVCNWTDGDFVFINSTCFDVNMLLRVYDISASMRKGSILITLSRSMVEVGTLARNIRDKCVSPEAEPPMWQLLFETREIMSWGSADYYVHQKLI